MVSTFRHQSCEDDLQNLKKSLVHLLPSSSQMLNILNIKLQKRFSSSKGPQIEFYLLEEDHDQLETNNDSETSEHPFVICVQRPNIWNTYTILIVAPPNPNKQMMEAFENFIEWDKVRVFSAVDQSFFTDHLQQLCLKHGNMTEAVEGMPCESYTLDPDFALSYVSNFSPEESVEVKELSVDDAAEMVRNFRFVWPHTQIQVEETIRNLTSAGVYVNSELASSALLSPAGLLNMVYTDKKHRRKGYGNIVLQTLSKSVASMGLIPMAECEVCNDSSRQLLKKLGFRLNSWTNWVWNYEGHPKS